MRRPSISDYFILLVASIIAIAYAYALFFLGGLNWKEEVLLSDGRIIVVERETLTKGGGDEWAHNRSLSMPKERRIRFAHPEGSGQIIEWRTTKYSAATWPERPLILDIEAGQPVVLAATSTGECENYSKYVFQNNAWVEERLPAKFETHMTNLLINDGIEGLKFVNQEDKRKENADFRLPKALKQVGPSGRNCR